MLTCGWLPCLNAHRERATSNLINRAVQSCPRSVVGELIANRDAFDFRKSAPGLARMPLLVLSSDDGLAPQTDSLIEAVGKNGGTRITRYHAATDHSWSDHRIDLAAQVIRWLQTIERPHR